MVLGIYSTLNSTFLSEFNFPKFDQLEVSAISFGRELKLRENRVFFAVE